MECLLIWLINQVKFRMENITLEDRIQNTDLQFVWLILLPIDQKQNKNMSIEEKIRYNYAVSAKINKHKERTPKVQPRLWEDESQKGNPYSPCMDSQPSTG